MLVLSATACGSQIRTVLPAHPSGDRIETWGYVETETPDTPSEDAATEADDPGFAAGAVVPVAAPSPASAAAVPLGPVGRIDIPKIGVSQPVFEGVTLDQLAKGPGHWPGTPIPGQPGNVVIAGHRTTHSHPFTDIDHLAPGDDIVLVTAQGRFVYQFTQSLIVDPGDTWIADPTPEPTVTLFACHPKGSAAHRFVARGRLVSAPAPAPASAAPSPAKAPPPPSRPSQATPAAAPAPPDTTPAPDRRCLVVCLGH